MLCVGSGKSHIRIQSRIRTPWVESCWERFRGSTRWKTYHEPTVYTCSLEGQQYLGLQQKRGGLQGVGGNCLTLCCLHEAPSKVLHPGLWLPTQKRFWVFVEGPEESNEDKQRAGAPLLWRQAEGIGLVQPGKEKAVGRPHLAFQYLKDDYKQERNQINM